MVRRVKIEMHEASRGLALLAVLILIAGLIAFRGAGRWLEREDPLAHADVIFVLGGGMPQRAAEGGRVYARATPLKSGSAGPTVRRPNWPSSESTLSERKSTTARS